MFTFPSYKQIASAPEAGASDNFDIYKAAKMRGMAGSFVPTMLPELNATIVSLGVPVLYDVPLMEAGQMQDCPYTNTKTGIIHMPHPDAFNSPEDYAHTLAHELSHWSGIKLQRPCMQPNGCPAWDMDTYAQEELTAEMTAMTFEQATHGKPLTRDWSMSYLRSYVDAPRFSTAAMQMLRAMGLPQPEVDMEGRFNRAVKQADEAVNYLLSHVKEPA